MANRSATAPQPEAKTRAGYVIGIPCPGCGGDLSLGVDFGVLACQYCNSALRVLLPDQPPAYLIEPRKNAREIRFLIDRYCKEQNQPLPGSGARVCKLLVPYWKLDGVLLRQRLVTTEIEVVAENGYETREREVEEKAQISISPQTTTVIATDDFAMLPATIGLRGEYAKLRPFSPDYLPDAYTPVAVSVELDNARGNRRRAQKKLSRALSTEDNLITDSVLVESGASLIYVPYLTLADQVKQQARLIIADCSTGRVSAHAGTDVAEIDAGGMQTKHQTITVELHRCDTCGADLPSSHSLVHCCPNCRRWQFIEREPRLSHEVKIAGDEIAKGACPLPFWWLRMDPKQGSAVQRLLGLIHKTDGLLMPAFGERRPELLARVAGRATGFLGQITSRTWNDLDRLDSQAPFVPITQSITQAKTLAELLLQKEYLRQTGKLSGTPLLPAAETIQLLLIPFRREGYFYTDALHQALSVEAALVG